MIQFCQNTSDFKKMKNYQMDSFENKKQQNTIKSDKLKLLINEDKN